MVAHLLQLLIGVGLAVVAAFHLFQWVRLRRCAVPAGTDLPPVTILKPLKGADADLESNLRTFFELDYPTYELVFGVRDRSDPALGVVRRVAAENPRVSVRIVVDSREVGYNPKVNNLANIARAARHDLLLISDSNVAVRPDYLRHMVGGLLQPGVGLVTSLIRGTDGAGLGGALESLQLNTFVMGGVALVSSLPGQVCAVGKSMLLRRSDLQAVGGFAELGRYLAEDQVFGELVRKLGRRVAVSSLPIDNVLGRLDVRRFAARHLRWARIRRHIAPAAYAAEVLALPVVPAVLGAVLDPTALSASVAATTLGAVSLLSLHTERMLGVKRSPLAYPLLELVRGFVLVCLWPVPFFSSTVEWRGRTYRIGKRTRLLSLGADPAAEDLGWAASEELRSDEVPAAS